MSERLEPISAVDGPGTNTLSVAQPHSEARMRMDKSRVTRLCFARRGYRINTETDIVGDVAACPPAGRHPPGF